MEYEKKTIGVLTSGGDAPGMNAAVRAVVRAAMFKGHRVLGIKRGYQGLLNKDIEELQVRSVSDILERGGTVLYTARCPEFRTEAGVQKAVDTCHEFSIDGLIVIGGDGSYRGARDLSNHGIPCIGIPGTIDNDIASTEYTIGFDTALNTVVQNVDRLRDTSQSHDRCSVVEVMGRHAGHLALYVGVGCGATAVLIPEKEIDFERDVIEPIRRARLGGRTHFMIIVAEGVGSATDVAKRIHDETAIDTRVTILGHVQRGGTPSARDRVSGTYMGYDAVMLLAAGQTNRVVCVQGDQYVDYDIQEALGMK
ncbi:MAG: 6-phosphofructokinase, partial [Angelakisella sp.]